MSKHQWGIFKADLMQASGLGLMVGGAVTGVYILYRGIKIATEKK